MSQKQEPELSYTHRWMLAIRPKTLPAAAAPVFLGWGLAAGIRAFHWGPALAALAGALLIQIGTNLVNDVIDFSKGADNEGRLGPTRATQAGWLTVRQMWQGVFASFGAAVLAGVYLAWVAGWPVIVIGLASLIAGTLYTAGPFAFAYNGLGDLFVMIFFGFVAVCGTVFVIAQQVPSGAWWAALAAGALTVNILAVNNIRDIESDRAAGRRNIPVLWGRGAGEAEYALMLLLAYLALPMLVFAGYASYWVFLAALTLPDAWKLWRLLRSGISGTALNPLLGKTAQHLLRYSVLLAIGLGLG